MDKIFSRYTKLTEKLSHLRDLPLLFMRLVLAYGFYEPATQKWKDINAIAEWYASMGIPASTLNAYLSALAEIMGVILLTLGLATRLISIPLMIVMVVAIVTVHWANGFQAGANGFEIPLYYLIMLFALLVFGPGKISLDQIIKKTFRGKRVEVQ